MTATCSVCEVFTVKMAVRKVTHYTIPAQWSFQLQNFLDRPTIALVLKGYLPTRN